ncbi:MULTISPECIES: PilW family protein [Comamonas]|uniref:PilW family protein n=1 Tax=Comamonas TaxID=283 RepID=UPI00257AC629|nr:MULTISPECIES: PilW family protein [Comamonas]
MRAPLYATMTTNRCQRQQQKGLSLVELMVGIAIGLLTVAVAMGALMASRSVTATVSDSSLLQQQSAYAFRVLAQQLRQAGSMRLNLAAQKTDGAAIEITDLVAFETQAPGFNPNLDILQGVDAPGTNQFQLTVGYRNYTEQLHIASAANNNRESLLRNCLGEQGSNDRILSRFVLRNNTLSCAGEGNTQPIVDNVANFQVRYLMQTTPHGNPQMQYMNAATVNGRWAQVFAVEVCLVLYGNEVIDMPAGSSYTDCPSADGVIATVDMTALEQPRNRRMHKTFRSVFQLRSQGLLQTSS